jgi:hypothetical protein
MIWGESMARRMRKGKDSEGKRMEICYLCVFEESIMKPTKHCKGGEEEGERENIGGGKVVQRTLYTCMVLSQ